MALALLHAGRRSPGAPRGLRGAMRVGNGLFHCHKRRGPWPAQHARRAIMQSCDIYFYEMVRGVGYDRIAPIAR
jgi:penicillin-binding protein 2